ncbi:MAG: carboxypeptidase regulatory-like domain-containing protein, partial [Sphingomonadales bacterium]
MRFWFITALSVLLTPVFSQNIIVKGIVKDAATNAPLIGAEVKILKTAITGKTDTSGNFVLNLAEPGFYVLGAAKEGYAEAFAAEILFTFDKSPFVQISMESLSRSVGTVNISRSALQARRAESPVGAQSLSIREIERNPGGNRDISKIVQSLPGVISVPSFRNDIVIRGGSPVENKFYLDGFEIPVINHFQTQGSTGGPVGILNVNFIKEVNFYTGAFPINYANGMSAVVDFRQIDGNMDKPKFRFTLGSSDLGFTADGPLGKSKKTTFIVSARQSYLQGLFTLLKLPFLPNFIDYQA